MCILTTFFSSVTLLEHLETNDTYACATVRCNRKDLLRWPTRDTLQTKKKRCKQKRNAANKNETLQTEKKRCKQKRNAANKKETLQTKKKR